VISGEAPRADYPPAETTRRIVGKAKRHRERGTLGRKVKVARMVGKDSRQAAGFLEGGALIPCHVNDPTDRNKTRIVGQRGGVQFWDTNNRQRVTEKSGGVARSPDSAVTLGRANSAAVGYG